MTAANINLFSSGVCQAAEVHIEPIRLGQALSATHRHLGHFGNWLPILEDVEVHAAEEGAQHADLAHRAPCSEQLCPLRVQNSLVHDAALERVLHSAYRSRARPEDVELRAHAAAPL
eukprot:CAMPEP_0170582864 /NCGR_PEP_ID=MMETSP0224-20130122/7815_1 /TAXON_ID=285029 /ORGANISM="Togula jolla, Strain CCCM 725" /LENGTH=116 /DNA_ID=CAMNT_0010906125 /DNA_START=124 /DNA_END=473 /DNA_ORIENTATION=+